MSERKTAEIKFRITPTEKARWQEQAESEQVALSEMIRQTVEQHCRVRQVFSREATTTDSPQEDVPTSDEADSVHYGPLKSAKPWMFEARGDA